MKLIRNIVVVLALILLGVVIGLALGGQGDGGGAVEAPSFASATSTRSAVPTATKGSGSEETSAPTASPAATVGSGAESGAEWGVVVRVADGDTLTVQFDSGEEETIRLLDVDTPETVHPNRPEECFGAQASDFTKTLMGQRVWIEEEGRDRYGRLLAYVWTGDEEDGVLWNVRLLEEGLAVYNDYGNPGQYADTTRAAAEQAMLAGVGLWSACEIGQRPTVVPTLSVGAGCPQGCVSQPDPSCKIKGNVNTTRDTKIYHVEGESSSYGRVNMKEGEGDLWFCTRAEAEANGFRAPGR
ncbi:MAG: thermonuclease family protein [Caldilineaceae bacterium SB0661_bin_32]|uniref:Thermonuclease family protein n=1 Tax=Caldilineaceae bacterium SB0661_bin_32 TaxID=2605255 RepID=A0A6B1DD25_9CHLR|nr:thermonuclease family protein [Caldilineaceae bacterium SB0661_bin_32]